MITTPLKRGFYSTSTPAQTLCDSGYHEYDRFPSSTVVHSLSPIREISPFKRRLTGPLNLYGFSESPLPSVCSYSDQLVKTCLEEINIYQNVPKRALDFSNISNFSENCCVTTDSAVEDLSIVSDISFTINSTVDSDSSNNTIDHGSKSVLKDQSCGALYETNVHCYYKFRSEKVDFLQKLDKINCTKILHDILQYLSPLDLCKICCVSKTWKQVVLNDNIISKRRKKFLKDRNVQKENLTLEAVKNDFDGGIKVDNPIEGDLLKPVLKPSNMILLKEPQEYRTKFNSFAQEGMNLKSGVLKTCPRCRFASKCQGGVIYFCLECSYVFCEICLNPFLKNHSCIKPMHKSIRPTVIGSKRSKRNLKRL